MHNYMNQMTLMTFKRSMCYDHDLLFAQNTHAMHIILISLLFFSVVNVVIVLKIAHLTIAYNIVSIKVV